MTRDMLVWEIAAREVKNLPPERRSTLLLDWWTLGDDDPAWEKLPVDLRKELQSADDAGDPLDKRYDPLLVIALSRGFLGMKNEYLLRRARNLGMDVENVVGEPELLDVCPCCLYRTLQEQGGYNVCPICLWEDDGQRKLDVYSHPNRMTLREGRAIFALSGSSMPQSSGTAHGELREAYSRYEGDVVRPD
jgi:hypothetical protein